MTNAIRQIRRLHWLQFPVQASLMALLVLLADRGMPAATGPRQYSTPVLLLLGGLVLLVGANLFWLARRMRPNLRRPSEENLRIYKGLILLRNSLLGIAGLPPLVTYTVTRNPLDLVFFGCLLLTICIVTAPTAKTYQRWLIK